MSEMKHDIPAHLLPSGEDHVISEDEAEVELNRQLDTDRWVYTEEPDDAVCPYCGCEYEMASWASRTTDATKGVCPYDTTISDFIIQFVHSYSNSFRQSTADSVQSFCSPRYEETLVTYPATPDYEVRRFDK